MRLLLGLVAVLALVSLAEGLPQRPAFLDVADRSDHSVQQRFVDPEVFQPTRAHSHGAAPGLKVLGLIVLGVLFVGGVCAASVAAPLWHFHRKHQSGWTSGTWFAMDSNAAHERLATGVPGMVWLTDKRLFALLMHFHYNADRKEDTSAATGDVEEAVLKAASQAGASQDTLQNLRIALRGQQKAGLESRSDVHPYATPPTCLVQGGGCLELDGASSAGGSPWFLKNANLDSCSDNHCYPSFDECVSDTVCTGVNRTQRNQAYVVQPHIQRPMLLDGRKFDMRVHVVVVARKQTAGKPSFPAQEDPAGLLQAFLFKEVIIKLARDPWNPDELESSAQHTNMHGAASGSSFHQRLLRDVPRGKDLLQACVTATEGCLRAARSYLHHGANINSRQVIGVDVMVDEDCRPWVLEFNYLPGDDPACMAPGVYEVAYIPIKQDLPKLASEPLLEGRPAIAVKGWQELNF